MPTPFTNYMLCVPDDSMISLLPTLTPPAILAQGLGSLCPGAISPRCFMAASRLSLTRRWWRSWPSTRTRSWRTLCWLCRRLLLHRDCHFPRFDHTVLELVLVPPSPFTCPLMLPRFRLRSSLRDGDALDGLRAHVCGRALRCGGVLRAHSLRGAGLCGNEANSCTATWGSSTVAAERGACGLPWAPCFGLWRLAFVLASDQVVL